MEKILSLEHVSISYKIGDFKDIGLKEWTMRHLKNNYHIENFMAVNDVSFTLNRGDMLGIIGSNGAGKSTLLKAITGVMEPRSGVIRRWGNVVALLELASGFDGDLTVKENAYLRGAMLGYTREFMDGAFQEIMDFSELWNFRDRPFKQLSTGMQSRLAFSIASMVQPEILVLDEVLSVGDGAFQEKSGRKMMEIINGGAATILVSHSLEQIRKLCNKILWLDHGKQIAFGETERLCGAYEAFLKNGSKNAELYRDWMPESKEDTEMKRTKELNTTEKVNEISKEIPEAASPAEAFESPSDRGFSRGDVINCYRYILGREPENEDVIRGCVETYHTLDELRINFLRSEEFRALFLPLTEDGRSQREKESSNALSADALLSDPAFMSRLRFALSQTRCIWGDPARLDIHPTCVLNDALLNTNCGTITMGACSFTGHGVSILTDAHYIERKDEARMDYPRSGRDIVIGKGVWLASGCTVLGPCKIGDDAVITGGAVVVPGTEIPAGTVWGGNPAKQIREIAFESNE